MPKHISKAAGGEVNSANTETSTFAYGADHQRVKQIKTGAQGNSTIYYAGAMEVELSSNTQALITSIITIITIITIISDFWLPKTHAKPQ